MNQYIKCAFMLFLLALPFMFLVLPCDSATSFANFNTGPYVDKIVYKEIIGDDNQVLALLNDEIDMIGDAVNPSFLSQLEANPNIEIARTLRNGYGHLTINCDKYPLNITAFRRALAFAIDKEEIATTIWDGEAIPHDCVIPAVSPWSYESYLTDTYYAAQPTIGNDILDAAGFVDIDSDGYREAPDGSDFQVVIEMPTAADSGIGFECGHITKDAFDALGIDSIAQATSFEEYISRVNFHGDFDIALYGYSFAHFEPYFLETMYGSEYYGVSYYNTVNWRNFAYDSWIPQLLHSSSYEDTLEAVNEMQRILWYEQPRIILYDNYHAAAYRTDIFEGHVVSAADGVTGAWTNLKVHRKTGSPFGGTFRIGFGGTPDSYNHMAACSTYSEQVLANMQNSLMKLGPDGTLVPWLTESYLALTHEDDSDVPEGHMRFYFDLATNATWSDGTPLTAEDAAFTLNYYKDSSRYGNPTNTRLTDMTDAYAPTPYSLVVEMDTVSFWHLSTIAYNTILPQHIFESIGVDDWHDWNPVYGSDPYVTSGPFYPSRVVKGDSHELVYNPAFLFRSRRSPVDSEMEYAEGSTGNMIEWDITSVTPLYYDVYRDDDLVDTESWDGSPIEYNVDGLSLGAYTYIIRAYYGEDMYYSFTMSVNVYDGTPPSIENSSDLTLHKGQAESVVVWTPCDLHPASYVIMVNESIVQSGLWNSTTESISFSMSSYEIGTYNVTLMVVDIGMNSANDSLLVTIIPYVPPIIGGDITALYPAILAITGIGAGIVILLVILVKKRT